MGNRKTVHLEELIVVMKAQGIDTSKLEAFLEEIRAVNKEVDRDVKLVKNIG